MWWVRWRRNFSLYPYNYAFNSPLIVIDPDGMEARPLDGTVTFNGYVGDDGNGDFVGSTSKSRNSERAKTESEIGREKGNLLYHQSRLWGHEVPGREDVVGGLQQVKGVVREIIFYHNYTGTISLEEGLIII